MSKSRISMDVIRQVKIAQAHSRAVNAMHKVAKATVRVDDEAPKGDYADYVEGRLDR